MKNKNKQTFICNSYQSTKKKSNQIEKGSYTSLGFDARSIASENIRRTSLAKLSALPLEAPITKVAYCSIPFFHSFIENDSQFIKKILFSFTIKGSVDFESSSRELFTR